MSPTRKAILWNRLRAELFPKETYISRRSPLGGSDKEIGDFMRCDVEQQEMAMSTSRGDWNAVDGVSEDPVHVGARRCGPEQLCALGLLVLWI
jgi:hypothetical protein